VQRAYGGIEVHPAMSMKIKDSEKKTTGNRESPLCHPQDKNGSSDVDFRSSVLPESRQGESPIRMATLVPYPESRVSK